MVEVLGVLTVLLLRGGRGNYIIGVEVPSVVVSYVFLKFVVVVVVI